MPTPPFQTGLRVCTTGDQTIAEHRQGYQAVMHTGQLLQQQLQALLSQVDEVYAVSTAHTAPLLLLQIPKGKDRQKAAHHLTKPLLALSSMQPIRAATQVYHQWK